ncbi:transglutaminase-like cysteine peptidase [Sphingomonas sp. DT-207]|uniref:transglutaminase-like cysteine peptidase n=1 Tax=Sphingomonas sp. DT-207 TaxID=3396167 RepID=UPI003F1C4F43
MRCVSVAGLALACAALAWGHLASAREADAPGAAKAGERALGLTDVPRWSDVLARVAAERSPESRRGCMMPAENLPESCGYSAWRAALAQLRDRPPGDQLAGVQHMVNQLPYVPDWKNWGMADRWETPGEMFARGGDCEGFALTKYFALRELGFDEAALRLAIVWDEADREQHAILFVEAGGTEWVLDNKFAAPMPAKTLAIRYPEIWSVNQDGARLSAGAFGESTGRMRLTRGGTTLVIRARPRRRDG